jgi:adenosylcobinamide amidohydrolase
VREDLIAAFNHDCKENGRKDTPLRAPTYPEHVAIIARELGLDPKRSCGLTTAASMENLALCEETYEDVTVTAAVTAGVDDNGGRAGDPASWHEPPGGTINIMLFISANLPAWTMARALMTATEAKTAALEELVVPSLYSSGLATGSGTDGMIIVCDSASPRTFTFAGNHAKLGELIGRVVIRAVKDALYKETSLCPKRQYDVFTRLGRYGVTRDAARARGITAENIDRFARAPELVTCAALYARALDELSWGLLTEPDVSGACQRLLRDAGMKARLDASAEKPLRERLIEMFLQGLASLQK